MRAGGVLIPKAHGQPRERFVSEMVVRRGWIAQSSVSSQGSSQGNSINTVLGKAVKD